jgi:hypothetical protein
MILRFSGNGIESKVVLKLGQVELQRSWDHSSVRRVMLCDWRIETEAMWEG